MSICILILSILVLGVRKALILVRSLDQSTDRESPISGNHIGIHEYETARKPQIIQEYRKKKPGIVPAIQEYRTAVEPQHETVIAGGVFIWRDIVPRKKRKEKKPKVRLKAVKCVQDGMIDRG